MGGFKTLDICTSCGWRCYSSYGDQVEGLQGAESLDGTEGLWGDDLVMMWIKVRNSYTTIGKKKQNTAAFQNAKLMMFPLQGKNDTCYKKVKLLFEGKM